MKSVEIGGKWFWICGTESPQSNITMKGLYLQEITQIFGQNGLYIPLVLGLGGD